MTHCDAHFEELLRTVGKEPGGGGRNADAACVNAALPVDYLGFAVMRPDGVLL